MGLASIATARNTESTIIAIAILGTTLCDCGGQVLEWARGPCYLELATQREANWAWTCQSAAEASASDYSDEG